MQARANGGSYRISLWLPPVDPPPGGFPVLYVLDADAMFAGFAEFVHRASRRPRSTGIEPVVLVGISRQGSPDQLMARVRDFTAGPPRDEPHDGEAGGAAGFLAFIEQEVMRAVHDGFPADRARQALFGHSLGGYFSLWVLTRRDTPFSAHFAVSPSIWWDPASLHDALAAQPAPWSGARHAPRVYLSAGEWEGAAAPWQQSLSTDPQGMARRERRRMIGNLQSLARRLEGSLPPGTVRCEVLAGEDHLSAVLPSIARSLRFWAGGRSTI